MQCMQQVCRQRVESSGYIDQKFTGRLMVKVGNFTHKKIQLSAGTPVAYIALASYSIE